MEAKEGESSMKVSSSTVNLCSVKMRRIWKPEMDKIVENGDGEIEAVGQGLLLSAHEFAQGGHIDGIDMGDYDARYITPSVVLGLASIATNISLLILSSQLEVGELSPLLIAPLGSQSLMVLTLTMSSPINGLLSTVAACCPRLEEFMLWRNFEDEDEDEEEGEEEGEGKGEEEMWRAEVKEIAMLLSKLKNLRILSLHNIRFDDSLLEAKEGLIADGAESGLKGLTLVDCRYGDSFLHTVTASGSLVYLDVVQGAAGKVNSTFEGMNYTFKSKGETIESGGEGEGRGVSDVISIIGERCGGLKSLSLFNAGVGDADIKALASYFPSLTRLALGDEGLEVTVQGLRFLKSSGLMDKLQSLTILNGGWEGGGLMGQEEEREGRGDEEKEEKEAPPSTRQGINDDCLIFEEESSRLVELNLMGLDVTPGGVARLANVLDLGVANCTNFDNPEEVCRLCRAVPELVIRTIKGDVFDEGIFRGAFYDCVEKEEKEEEQEEKDQE